MLPGVTVVVPHRGLFSNTKVYLLEAILRDGQTFFKQPEELLVGKALGVFRTAGTIRNSHDQASLSVLSIENLDHVACYVAVGTLAYIVSS